MGLSDLILGLNKKSASGQKRDIANIVEFIESPWGLNPDGNLSLWPVQRVLLKAHYGLELDSKTKFDVTDWKRDLRARMTEKEYLKFLFEEGRCNIGEIDHERREMILSVGRRSGKCITGDSLILTSQGVLRLGECQDPVGPEYSPFVVTVAQEGSSTRSRSSYFYRGGIKPIRNVTTRLGYHISGTPEHRVRVLTPGGIVDWRYLKDLTPGDVLCIHMGSDLWATTPTHLGDQEITPDVAEALGVTQGYKLCHLPPDLSKGHVLKVVAKSGVSRQWLMDSVADCSGVPDCILQAPKEVVAAYLRGLFGASARPDVRKTPQCHVVATSGLLLSDIQVLLLNFGILSIREAGGDGRVPWQLTVLGPGFMRFADEIGWNLQASIFGAMALRAIAKPDDPHPERYHKVWGFMSSVPYQEQWLDWFRLSCTKGQRELLGRSWGTYFSQGYAPPRELLPVFGGLVRLFDGPKEYATHFESLGALPYAYDEVVAISEGNAPVFDLNVPNGESFVANGLTNHNTTITAAIVCYETYKLLMRGDPQEYYGSPPGSNIQIVSVATDKDVAGLLYNEASSHFKNCAFFSQYAANNTMSYARFQTPKDIERFGRYLAGKTGQSKAASLRVTFKSAVAKGLRGAANIVTIMDEAAHYPENGEASCEKVYDAITPSTATFNPKDPRFRRPMRDANGVELPSEGRIIMLSSPLARSGFFYRMFQLGMAGGPAADNMICTQAPTWEVNPTLPASEFSKHYHKNATVFFTEFGGQFSDRSRGWIEDASDLLACVDPNLRPVHAGISRRPYYMGIDFGLTTDGTAVAIGHIDQTTQKVVLDWIGQMQAGRGKYADKARLDFDDVADWVADLAKRFYINEAIFDQWAGVPFEQALHKRGLKQCRAMAMTETLNSEIYKTFKDVLWDRKISLYDYPLEPKAEHCSYIQELLELQVTVKSKYLFKVAAPQVEGKHDDLSDALVRMTWLAIQTMRDSKGKKVGGAPPVIMTTGGGSTPSHRHDPGQGGPGGPARALPGVSRSQQRQQRSFQRSKVR